ncbi:hypothetical protein AA0115_g9401 [Alternaria tenuissima]|uniref:Uncharacterized protein n=1 Tax=Alternaria tenuissima TaxID=119927 RepID=A0AB37WA42_9PLEO|nr:hypothetical protein AA0115_g9401 [Alternaria tenuissima]
MAQWQGDWGFEDHILQRVEDGVPPYTCSTNSLRAFVQAKADASVDLPDWTLQQEACEIIRRIEDAPNATLEGFAGWLIHAIGLNNVWLSAFKLRTSLPSDNQNPSAAFPAQPVDDQGLLAPFPMEPSSIAGILEDPFHTTAHGPSPLAPTLGLPNNHSRSHMAMGTNFYRLFANDLRRWVLATMSPSNPGCHVPSDAEIQHHARWIIYESDDPWNQTAADHPEWLWRFKKDVGIIGTEDSTGTMGL